MNNFGALVPNEEPCVYTTLYFFVCLTLSVTAWWAQRHVRGVGRDRPPARTQWGRPSLHLCETWHGLRDGARGFRAAHPKLPALNGLFSRMRCASCINLVRSGSCSDDDDGDCDETFREILAAQGESQDKRKHTQVSESTRLTLDAYKSRQLFTTWESQHPMRVIL